MATQTSPIQRNANRWAREYETIYIMRPDVEPDNADKVAKRVSEVVERLGGKLTRVDNWGKRRLAYNIARHSRGIFVYLRYVGYNDLVRELERNFKLLDDVVRWQTVKLRDRVEFDSVEVDPEEIKFRQIEPTEDEEEPGIEQRLGFAAGGGVEEERSAPEEEAEEDEEAEVGAADEEQET